MIARIIFFLIGFGLSTIGFVFIISYLNLITIGYTLKEYVHFISSNIECLIGPIVFKSRHLQYFFKEAKK